VVFGVWAVARSSGATPATVDLAVVAIAPFRVTAGDSSLGYLREGMVDLLATKLSGTAALRPTDRLIVGKIVGSG